MNVEESQQDKYDEKEVRFPLLDENNVTFWILIEDILYFNRIEEDTTTITRRGNFKHFLNLPESYSFLKNYGFELLGKSLMVNVSQISFYDSEENILYFDKEFNEKGLKLYTTKKATGYVKSVLGCKFDMADKKHSISYSPMFSRKSLTVK